MATSDYYDEVDEEAYERSAQNRSVPSPESRDLWQRGNVATDGSGPTIEDVVPAFAQARADALANPTTADDNDEELKNSQADSAAAAQEKADAIRDSHGYVAPTGADAGNYDDDKLEESVPAENFNAAPKDDETETTDEADETTASTDSTDSTDHEVVQADEADETQGDFATREDEAKA